MDISKLQAINLSVFPIDLLICVVFVFAVFGAIKRGFFREFLIFIANVPYIAVMFYLFNSLIQNDISFDSFFYKASALGALYIAYLVFIWFISKTLNMTLANLSPAKLMFNRIGSGFISILRTTYFFLACLVFFNLHINQQYMIEKSDILMKMNPYALKIQDYLLSNSIIKNEITLYEDAINGRFDEQGNFVHPLMDKMKESEKFKQIENSIDVEALRKQVENQLKGKL